MKPKSFLLLLMFFIFGSMLFAQNISEDSLRVIVRAELNRYNELRAQIDKLGIIAAKRVEAKKLNSAGNMTALIQGFEIEEKQLTDFLKTKDSQAASDKLVEIKLIYKDIPYVEDRILYNKAMIDFSNKQYESSQIALEDFVNRFPNSSKFSSAICLLDKVYIYTGQETKLIDLEATLTSEKTSEQVFWIGQANYNLGEYDKAYNSFITITGDKIFGLRTKAMLALIVACIDTPDASLVQFLKIKDEYTSETPYYDFVMLCIARLYAELGNLDDALSFYSIYTQMNLDTSPNEIKYEMAIALKNSGRYSQAEALFNQILSDPMASEYYTSSIYMIAYMKGLQGDDAGAKDIVDSSKKLNDDFLQQINEKHLAIYRLRDLRDQFFNTEDRDTRIAIVDEMGVLEKKISDIDLQLTNTSSGINAGELKKLRNIEEKYVAYQNLLTQEVLKIKQLMNKPNDQQIAVIDRDIALLDSTYVKALAYNLLANLPEVTTTKYEIAQIIAREIWEEKKALNDWKQVVDMAKRSGNTSLSNKSNAAVSSLEENVASLELAANHYFGNYSSNPDKEREIRQTLQDIITTREALSATREDVAKNFNRKLASKMLRDTKGRIDQYDDVFKVYDQQFVSLNNQIDVLNQQFEYTLLELQYIRTLNNDKLLQKESERTDQKDQGTGSQ
jgi:TolA-binding protein